MESARARHPAGRLTNCIEDECGQRSVVIVRRAHARNGRPVCETHAHHETLVAERYGYDVTITAVRQPSPQPALFAVSDGDA